MSEPKQIDGDKAKELLAGGNVTIVDIRRPEDYKSAHIEGAQSLSDDNVEEFVNAADKTKPLICYCYHGMSSQGASQYFADNGFNEVYSLIGGFEEWKINYPVIT